MPTAPRTAAAPSPAEPLDQMTNQLMKACTEMGNIASDSMNAALESATAFSKGWTEMFESFTGLLQNSLEQTAEASKAMMNAKNMRDLMDTQSALVKEGFDFMVNEASKLSQISSRTAQQASEPMANNIQATITKITKTKAA